MEILERAQRKDT